MEFFILYDCCPSVLLKVWFHYFSFCVSWAPIWNWYDASSVIWMVSVLMWQCSSSAEDDEEICNTVNTEVGFFFIILLLHCPKTIGYRVSNVTVGHWQWDSFSTHSFIIEFLWSNLLSDTWEALTYCIHGSFMIYRLCANRQTLRALLLPLIAFALLCMFQFFFTLIFLFVCVRQLYVCLSATVSLDGFYSSTSITAACLWEFLNWLFQI